MISSGTLGQTVIPIIHEMSQVNTVYIFCGNIAYHEQWTKNWTKIKGVFADIKPICEALKQAVHKCDRDTISMSFVSKNNDTTNKNLNQLDQSFMHTLILKEIILTIDFDQFHIQEFITYCREELAGNHNELENVDKLEREYRKHSPIWWYTYECFLYSMLNRALRTMEVALIVNMSFFVQDLHNLIRQLHFLQYAGLTRPDTFIVYRGQGLSQKDFDQLFKTKGGLLSFNNFLSTSMNREISLTFARETIETSDLMGILFVMKIDPSIPSTPFANICNVSHCQNEEEILFSMHSIFRIEHVEQIDNNNTRLWQVELALTSDNDPELHVLSEYIRQETYSHSKGWDRLGMLLIKLGQFDKSEQVYNFLLVQTTVKSEKAHLYHMLGMIKNGQGKYTEAIIYYEKSIENNQKILFPNYADLAASHTSIGIVYNRIGEYSKALSFHEKALRLYQKTLPPNHPDLASSYNNIGLVYDKIGQYLKALSYYEKALTIRQTILPQNHPDLASSYDNIGQVYNNMGEYLKALSFHKKAFEIRQTILPQNHPYLATSYGNIGQVYNNTHEYSKALSFHEKALEIRQTILPQDHPHLATSYGNIGQVYNNMGEYLKALSYYEKALEIRQKTLPENHPNLAISYENMEQVYNNMGKYSEALSYYEKAFEIYQKTLPPKHPDLALCYNYIGTIYDKMGHYKTALSFFECALDIGQRSLPPCHPNLQKYKNNVKTVKKKL